MGSDSKSLDGIAEIEPPFKFPFCLVWTQLPFISWVLPMIGHIGICDSKGTIHDFAGTQFVNTGKLSFGHPLRYWKLNPADAAALVTSSETTNLRTLEEPWDESVMVTSRMFQQYTYSLWSMNCHSFAASMLSEIQYGGNTQWGIVQVAASMFCLGKFVSFSALLRTWGPCLVTLLLTAYFLGWGLATFHVMVLCIGSIFLRVKTASIRRDKPAIYRAATV